MNQFKRAKEKTVASGHKPEKITDLMTAGIKGKNEAKENVDKIPDSEAELSTSVNEETETQMQKKVSDIVANNKTTISSTDISDSLIVTQTQNDSSEILLTTKLEAATSEDKPDIEQIQSIPNSDISSVKVNRTNETNTFTIENAYSPVEQIQNLMPKQENSSSIIIEETPSVINNSIITEPIEKAPIAPPLQSNEIPIPVPVAPQTYISNEQTLSIPQPHPSLEIPVNQLAQVTNNTVIQTVATSPVEPTVKKKIPNIFAPKEEAKSMRKSLVLKPTSVKKAESYCSKNGGSFNELIQTLLDNFIDEYGL